MDGSGNLENIFRDIVRLGDHIEFVENEVLDMIAELSDENPRDDLWMLTKAVYDNIQKAKLTTKDLINTINKAINEYHESDRKSKRSDLNFKRSYLQQRKDDRNTPKRRLQTYNGIFSCRSTFPKTN